MTAAYWRLRRAWTIETELLDSAYANQPAGQYPTRIAGAFSDLADTPTLTALHRDETRLHVMFQRCLQNLVVLRHLKPGKDDTPIALPQFLLDKIKPTDPPEMRNEPNNSLPANKIIDVKPSANPNPNPPAPPAEPTKPNAVSEAGDLQRRECPDFRTDPQAGVP